MDNPPKPKSGMETSSSKSKSMTALPFVPLAGCTARASAAAGSGAPADPLALIAALKKEERLS